MTSGDSPEVIQLKNELQRLKSAVEELTVLNDLAIAASSSLEVDQMLDPPLGLGELHREVQEQCGLSHRRTPADEVEKWRHNATVDAVDPIVSRRNDVAVFFPFDNFPKNTIEILVSVQKIA